MDHRPLYIISLEIRINSRNIFVITGRLSSLRGWRQPIAVCKFAYCVMRQCKNIKVNKNGDLGELKMLFCCKRRFSTGPK